MTASITGVLRQAPGSVRSFGTELASGLRGAVRGGALVATPTVASVTPCMVRALSTRTVTEVTTRSSSLRQMMYSALRFVADTATVRGMATVANTAHVSSSAHRTSHASAMRLPTFSLRKV